MAQRNTRALHPRLQARGVMLRPKDYPAIVPLHLRLRGRAWAAWAWAAARWAAGAWASGSWVGCRGDDGRFQLAGLGADCPTDLHP